MSFFERYRLGRLMARGGTAEIFEATERGGIDVDRKVVVKRLSIELCEDSMQLRAFRDEARLLGRLDHPNIVAIINSGAVDGLPFQVLEHVDGGDLELLASAGRMPEELALYVGREVGRALEHVHEAGIVHRDVTPENVVVSRCGEVKLIDFGVAFAAVREERTAMGVAKGKLEYMAPEQLEGRPVDPRTDVFALGCVLHRLVAGASPLESRLARQRIVEGRDPVLAADLPTDVARVVARAVSAAPKMRYRSAGELAIACDAALAGRSAGAPRDALAAWIGEMDLTIERSRAHPARDLVDLDLVLERDAGELPATALATRRLPPRERSGPRHAVALIGASLVLGAVALALQPAPAGPGLEVKLPPMALAGPLAVSRVIEEAEYKAPMRPIRTRVGRPVKPVIRGGQSEVQRTVEPIGEPALVLRKLDSISRRLLSERSRLPPARFNSFELRYFELRSALQPDAPALRCAELLEAANVLEHRIGEASISLGIAPECAASCGSERSPKSASRSKDR